MTGKTIGISTILQTPTATHTHPVTITVIGGGHRDRLFAQRHLVPVVLECVRVLQVISGARPVHVTYCNACPARVLPMKQATTLTSENVNGGVCMGTWMGVLVFRRQDAVKVLIHELLHLFGVDEALRSLSPQVEAKIIRPCRGLWGERKGTLPIHLSEAYTDAIACLIFCGDHLRARACAVDRAARILIHFGAGRVSFREDTHVFSYYVVKAAMLTHAPEFVSLLHTFKMQLVPNESEVPSILNFMDRTLRSTAFHNSLHNRMRELQMSGAFDKDLSMTDGQRGWIRFSEVGVLI